MQQNIKLTTTQAAARLRAAFGETAGYWPTRLQNERKPERSNSNKHPLPWFKEGGRFFYMQQTLDLWIAGELARRLAKGQVPISRAGEVLEAYGANGNEAATGRRLETRLTPQFDEERGEHFAQMVITSPLLVFRLSPAQVREMATEFAKLADQFDRWAGKQSSQAAQAVKVVQVIQVIQETAP